MSKTTIPTGGITADAINSTLIADDAVSEEHLDATAITGSTELASTPADTDEILISDAGTLKRIDFSHIKSSGLTQSDMWYMTSNITEDVGFITANWTRYTGPGGNIGSALTQSSGVFTFPSTGFYKIDYIIGFRNQSSNHAFTEVYCQLFYTQDNSSYTDATTSFINVSPNLTQVNPVAIPLDEPITIPSCCEAPA